MTTARGTREREPALAAAQRVDQLVALARREPADRLARRDLVLREDPADLHAPVLRDAHEDVDDLHRVDELRGVAQEVGDAAAPAPELPLQVGALRAHGVGLLERLATLDRKSVV
jgi:hypothetical protein